MSTHACPIQPCEEMVVLKRDEAVKQVGSVVLSQESVRKPFTGILLAKGPASAANPNRMDAYTEGDRLLYDRRADTVLDIGGEEFILVNVRDIRAILKTDKAVHYAE